MTAFMALLVAVVAAEPRVTGLSVAPAADRTEVTILVDGSVSPRHMMLEDGRLVVDLDGVRQAPRLDYRELNRGGVRELRVAQFQPNVARVVITLAGRVEYEVTNDDGRIRVSFPNRAGTFEAWSRQMAGTAPPAPRLVAPDAAPARPVVQQTPPQQPRQDRRIRITFDNRPLTEVLGIFSDLSGRTIMPAPGVQARTITADLRDVPWPDALAGILEANGLTIREIAGGILLVQDAASAVQAVADEPTVTETFPIQYTSADSIRVAIQGLATPGTGRVTVNRSSNALLVTDAASVVQRIRETIPLLDVKTPQVDISATIAFIDRTALESFGVVYDLKDSRGNQFNRVVTGGSDRNGDGIIGPDETSTEDLVLLGGPSIAALGNANYRVPSPSLEVLATLVLGRHSLAAFIESLQTISMSDIQAKPVIRTMDHRSAKIQVGEETPIRVLDAGSVGGGAGAPRASVEMKQTGVILEVTPHIIGDQVLLELRAERSNVAAGPSDVGAIFQTQNALTEVLVNDGETTVIAGLTIIEKTTSRAGIPLLMDLPVIGKLFRNETTRENKRDLLIMVRPHIVRD